MDAGTYVAVIFIGAFITLLGVVVGPGYPGLFLFIYLAAVAMLFVISSWRVYLIGHIPAWQKPFARLPMRFAGFGQPKMKPLDAGRGHGAARKAAMVTTAVCLVVLAVAAWVIFGFFG